MKKNMLRMAIRSTAVAAMMGVAAQAGAVDFKAGGYDMSIYGYARLNATYDIDENIATSRGTRSANYGAINTGAAEDNEVTGHFGADAVQSRLGFRVMTPEGVKINLEGDFRGNSGTSNGNLRLRHAYGEYNGVMMGRYWSNYNSFVGNTSQLDFDGVPGTAGFQSRTSQVRYTTGPLSFSLEQPNAGIASGVATKTSLPAITARLDNSAGGLSYSVAAIARQVEYDTGTADDSVIGFGAFAAAKLALSNTISIQGALNFSEGANGYLYRSGNNFFAPDAYVDGNGDLETISGYGGTLGVSVDTGNGSSVNVLYGTAMTDLDDALAAGAVAGSDNESNSMAAVNYQWTPVKSVTMGVQYAYHMVEDINDDDGDASRLHFSAQYNF